MKRGIRRGGGRIVVMFGAVSFALVTVRGSAQEVTLDWWSIDSGGAMFSSAGPWQLSGTIGQWDGTPVKYAAGGSWALTGGFWSLSLSDNDLIFRNGFED